MRVRRPRVGGFGVALVVTACGGTEIDVYRHTDGRGAGGSASIGMDAGTAGISGSDSGQSSGEIRLQCAQVPAVLDWQSPLTCSSSACTASGIQLVPSEGAHAVGSVASTGATAGLWEWSFDAQGSLVSSVHQGWATWAPVRVPGDTVVVRLTDLGIVLGLSGQEGSYPDGTLQAEWLQSLASGDSVGGSSSGLAKQRTVLVSFVATALGSNLVSGTFDAEGNVTWGTAAGGSFEFPSDVILGVEQDAQGNAFWYRTNTTDQNARGPFPPDSAYARTADSLEKRNVTTGRVEWTAPLAVHSIVRLRSGAAGRSLVGGVLATGSNVLDVRALTPDGTTAWAVSPTSPDGSVTSLAMTHDGDGGALVAWNFTGADGEPSFTLQHVAPDGSSCTERTFRGKASDLMMRVDGRLMVATAQAILQTAP